jgi:chromosomal replication initiator protein
LEGAITKVVMLAKVSDRNVDLAMAEEALGSEPSARRREVMIEDILDAVMTRYSVRLADLQSKRRSRSIAFPRQICMYLARNLTRHSLEEIGGYFGGRDHTTVLHANRTIETRRQHDPQFQATLLKIRFVRGGPYLSVGKSVPPRKERSKERTFKMVTEYQHGVWIFTG